MSVVIIGGHDRMVSRYKEICKGYRCKAKVFTQPSTGLKEKIGSADLIVLFTNTVSHKMVISATKQAGKKQIPVVRSHTSSAESLKCLLEENAC